jgi:hypothetical protein
MSLFVLDTDILTLYYRGDPVVVRAVDARPPTAYGRTYDSRLRGKLPELLTMTDHSVLLTRYRRIREVRLQLNNVLVGTIPKRALQECGRKLGYLRKNTLVFDSEDDMAVLMD